MSAAPQFKKGQHRALVITPYGRSLLEVDRLIETLARLYDSVQRGDFETVGVHGSKEAQAAITLLKTHGATFDEFSRRAGAIDKHGNATEPDTLLGKRGEEK